MTDAVTFRDFRGTKGVVDDADTSDRQSAPVAPPTVIRSNAVTAEQVLRTERTPAADEGARSFGTPLGTETERQKKAQSTDSSQ